MKYVYTGGPYREFRGRVFANGQPVDITDRGTLEAIKRAHDFVAVLDDEPLPEEIVVEPQAPENACPKCGKALKKQGAHFHIRACQG